MTELRDPYDVLQIDPAASPAVVRAAYRRLARTHHPDRGGSSAAMSRLNAAYSVLRDPARRAGYDAARRRAAADGSGQRAASVSWNSRSASSPGAPSAGPRPSESDGPLARARARTAAGQPESNGRTFGSAAGGQETAGTWGPAWVGGAAARPPGNGVHGPDGSSVLDFGRYSGWSLAEVARTDPDFLEWLERMPIGRQFGREIDACLRAVGRRGQAPSASPGGTAVFARASSRGGEARRPLRLAFLRRA